MMEENTRSALIVVDCQNDFADADGALAVEGGAEVVARANAEIVRTLAGGDLVVYTQDWHPESTPHFEKDGGIWPVHCVGGSWGAEFHPTLLVAGPSIRKGVNGEDGYSGFTTRNPETGEETATPLHELLMESRVTEVKVVGLALDYCVRATALDAATLGYRTTVIEEATAAVDLEPGDGEKAVAEMREAGVTVI